MVAVQALVTVFQAPLGIRRAIWNGESEANVSLLQCLFKGERSTVLRGDPSFFLVMTILWHHSTGSPYGTFSITSSRHHEVDLSKPYLANEEEWLQEYDRP